MNTTHHPEPIRRLDHQYRRQLAGWAWYTLVTGIGCGGSGLWAWWTSMAIVPGIGLILFGSLFLIGLIGLPTSWLYAPAVDRKLEAFQRGECLAGWHYDWVEWLPFAETDWREGWQGLVPWFAVEVLGAIAGGIGVLLASRFGDQVQIAAWMIVGMALFWLLVTSTMLGQRYVHYQRARHSRSPAYIGKTGLYCNGDYWGFDGYGERLVAVRLVQEQPLYLEFTIRTGFGRRTYDNLVRVPVPAGHEREARHIVHVLCGEQ